MTSYTGLDQQKQNMIDWTEILHKIGVDVPLGAEQFNIECPFHKDDKPSLAINTNKGVWICFAGCGQGSLKSFIRKRMGWSARKILDFLVENSEGYDPVKMFEIDTPAPLGLSALEEKEFPFKQYVVPKWIFDRGFDKFTLNRWGCGITSSNGLVIPAHDKDAKLVGWIIRREFGVPKYVYAKGFKKSHILFGQPLVDTSNAVCITEGALDAMWLNQLGYQAVALLGMQMSKVQEELILELPSKEIILCLDNDEAGEKGRDYILTRLRGRVNISYLKLPIGYKDVQEVKNYDTIKETIENRRIW